MISGDKDSLCLSVSIHTVVFWTFQLMVDWRKNENYQYKKKKVEDVESGNFKVLGLIHS